MSDAEGRNELEVELYNLSIGSLQGRGNDPVLAWSEELEATGWELFSPVLSNSLPLGKVTDPNAGSNFFGGLLPEGRWLGKLANEIGTGDRDIVGLFSKVGGDLAGALRVGVSDHEASDPEELTSDDVRTMLEGAGGFMIGGGGSALAGYQRKIALSRIDGRWYAGRGSTPSTHILKPVLQGDEPQAYGEDYTLALARHMGLSSFETRVEDVGGITTLVIERYDRVRVGSTIKRLHQEDAAQALSLPWYDDSKFEEQNSRSNLKAVAGLLDEGRTIFSKGESDVDRLLRYTTFNVAVGNTDAHAKNFSIIRPKGSRAYLAPLYDAAPIALRYEGRRTLAMKVAGHSYQPTMTTDHLIEEAGNWGISDSNARRIVLDTLEKLIDGTRTVAAHPSIAALTPGYIRGQAQNLAEGKPAEIAGATPPALRKFIGTPSPRASDV